MSVTASEAYDSVDRCVAVVVVVVEVVQPSLPQRETATSPQIFANDRRRMRVRHRAAVATTAAPHSL
jgi:hypothetical protein